MRKALQLYHTVKCLKPIQVYYRLYYFTRKRSRRIFNHQTIYTQPVEGLRLTLEESIHIIDCYEEQNTFIFLNLKKKFEETIDWNYNKYGKLWTYNLNYFDFLSQYNSSEQLYLLHDFIDNIENIKDGLEPFPISLRGINWIKFLTYHKIKEKRVEESLYAQYYILLDNLEYHLLGNHLLENAFSLLFGAYFFKDEKFYRVAKDILSKQITEQILEDGGHFELSPMYHQIMLFRLLDCINLLKNNDWKEDELLEFLIKYALKMLGWLEGISYENKDIPLFNDSTVNIAPTTKQLFDYADRLQLTWEATTLVQSGYRKISNLNHELIVDVGEIGASYIPGHVHADTFNFELRINGKPFIVDRGLSTYETGERRSQERATSSHNTVEINGKNQSDVWGGFRVGKRASIVYLKEEDNSIEARHNGYKDENVFHTRKWRILEDKIVIEDSLNIDTYAVARFYFAPNIKKIEILNRFTFDSELFTINSYEYSLGFNKLAEANVLEIKFSKTLKVEIYL